MTAEIMVSKVLDALIDKGESDLKNALLRQSRRKIFRDTCIAFAEMSRTSSEFPELHYMKDAIDMFYAIMELEMSIKTDVSMMYMNQMSKALENSYCQPEMIHAMLVGWCNRALSMEKYYKDSI